MQTIDLDLDIQQGATFSRELQWCSSAPVHKVISGVTVGLPTLVEAIGHGLTTQTPVWITNVRGPRTLNTDDYRFSEPLSATVIDADNLAIEADTGSQPAYQSGGVLTYYSPLDLTGYTARMQVRQSVGSEQILLELTTEDGGIAIDAATGTITLQVSATDSAAFTWRAGVYDLELIDTGGAVTRLASGAVTVCPEVTR